mgnify:CR=1 FL=1
MIHWDTHACGYYCTEEVHAFECLSLNTPQVMESSISRTSNIHASRLVQIREAPEALEAWQQRASSGKWIRGGPSRQDEHAYLVFLAVRRGEQPDTLLAPTPAPD